jgi:hypothetical protein
LGIFARDAGCASVRKGRGIGAAGAAGEICRFATGLVNPAKLVLVR